MIKIFSCLPFDEIVHLVKIAAVTARNQLHLTLVNDVEFDKNVITPEIIIVDRVAILVILVPVPSLFNILPVDRQELPILCLAAAPRPCTIPRHHTKDDVIFIDPAVFNCWVVIGLGRVIDQVTFVLKW